MSEKHISIEYQDQPPSPVKVTKLGRGVMIAAAGAAAAALLVPMTNGDNPVGEGVHTVLGVGVDVVDAVPGVDLPDHK